MTQNRRLHIVLIILFLEVFGPLSVLFPCRVESMEIALVDKRFKSDFGLFMFEGNSIGMNFIHLMPSNIVIGHWFDMPNFINIVNESGPKLRSTFIKFLTLNHRHGIYATDEGSYQNSEQTETCTYEWGEVCRGIGSAHDGPPEWILSVIGGTIGIFVGVFIVLGIFHFQQLVDPFMGSNVWLVSRGTL